MSATCVEVRRALEDAEGATSPQVALHLAECPTCAAQAGVVRLLDSLAAGEGDEASARRLILDLPPAAWQLRRAHTWVPLAGGVALAGGGLALLGGVPAPGTLSTLPGGAYGWLASAALDVATAARGSADAMQALLVAAGSSALVWLGLSALGGSLALRALLRHSAPQRS